MMIMMIIKIIMINDHDDHDHDSDDHDDYDFDDVHGDDVDQDHDNIADTDVNCSPRQSEVCESTVLQASSLSS